MLDDLRSSVRTGIESIQCGSLINKKLDRPIVLDCSMTIADATEILSHYSISSAPVYNPNTQKLDSLFDFRDVCGLFVDSLDNKDIHIDHKTEFRSLIQDITVENAKKTSQYHDFYAIESNQSLLNALPFFGNGVHRFAVIDENDAFKGVISQSDAIFAINQVLKDNPLSEQITLDDMGIARKQIVLLDWEMSVCDALKAMRNGGVSSVGLVDEGILVGVISMTDIKYLFHKKAFRMLKDSCGEFAGWVRKTQEDELGGKAPYPVFQVRPNASLGFVLRKLVATRSHRIFVTSPTGEPIGVVSMTDILRTLNGDRVSVN